MSFPTVHDLQDHISSFVNDNDNVTSAINLYFHGTCKTIEDFTIRIVELNILSNFINNLEIQFDKEFISSCVASQNEITRNEFEKMLQDIERTNIKELFFGILNIESLEPDYFHNSKNKIIENVQLLHPTVKTHKEFTDKIKEIEYLQAPYIYKNQNNKEEFDKWQNKIEDILIGIDDIEFFHKFIQPLKILNSCLIRFEKNWENILNIEIPKSSICGIDLPIFLIPHEIARKLTSLNLNGEIKTYKNEENEDEKELDEEKLKLSNENKKIRATHPVYLTEKVCYKLNATISQGQDPEHDPTTSLHPEYEFAVSSLYNIFGYGRGVATTNLLKISNIYCPNNQNNHQYHNHYVQASEKLGEYSAKDFITLINLPNLFDKYENKKQIFCEIYDHWDTFINEFINEFELKDFYNANLSDKDQSNFLRNNIFKLFQIIGNNEKNHENSDEIESFVECVREGKLRGFINQCSAIPLQIDEIQAIVQVLALKYKYPKIILPENDFHDKLFELAMFSFPFNEIKKYFQFTSSSQAFNELTSIWDKLDDYEFCIHYLITILSNQLDHHADNLRISIKQNYQNKTIEKISFIGIDNDQAFSGNFHQMKTILFNFTTCMNKKISKKFIKFINSKSGAANLIIQWICALQEQNKKYTRWEKLKILNPIIDNHDQNDINDINDNNNHVKIRHKKYSIIIPNNNEKIEDKYITYLSLPFTLQEDFLQKLYFKLSVLFDNKTKLEQMNYWDLFKIIQNDNYNGYIYYKNELKNPNVISLCNLNPSFHIKKQIPNDIIHFFSYLNLNDCIKKLFFDIKDPDYDKNNYFYEEKKILQIDHLHLLDKLYITEKLLSEQLILFSELKNNKTVDDLNKIKNQLEENIIKNSSKRMDENDIFFESVKNGYITIVSFLIAYQKSAKVDPSSSSGEDESIKFTDRIDKNGQTGFLLACSTLNCEMINLLLLNNSNPRILDHNKKNALYILASKYLEAPQIVSSIFDDFFIQKKINLKILWNQRCGNKNKTILYKLIEKLSTNVDNKIIGNVPLIDFLIKKGCCPDLICDNGKTSLDLAIENNKKYLIHQLIQLGAGKIININILNSSKIINNNSFLFNKLLSNSLYIRWIKTLHLFSEKLKSQPPSLCKWKIKFYKDIGFDEKPILFQGFLPNEISSKIIDDKGGNIIKRFSTGNRNVNRIKLKLNDDDDDENPSYLYIKQDPESPGIEYAVNRLLLLLIGHGTSFSTLGFIQENKTNKISLKIKKKQYPILISLGIGGKKPKNLNSIIHNDSLKNLQTNIKQQNDEIITKQEKLDKELENLLDRQSFSELFLASLLVNYEDGKPDNFIIEYKIINNKQKAILICIDNDHSFLPPFIIKQQQQQQQNKTTLQDEQNSILVKNIIYCFSLMQEEIHPKAREKFLSLPNYFILKSWLENIKERNEFYSTLYGPSGLLGNYNNEKLCPFKEGSISDIYQKLFLIQSALKEPKITLIEIFKIVMPNLGCFYEHAFKKKELPTIFQRFTYIAGIHYRIDDGIQQCNTMLTTKANLNHMNIPMKSKYKDGNISKSLIELEKINKQLNNNQQNKIINQLIKLNNITEIQIENEFDKISSNEKSKILTKINFKHKNLSLHNHLKILNYFCNQNLEFFKISNSNQFNYEFLKKLLYNSPGLRFLEIKQCELCFIDDIITLFNNENKSNLLLSEFSFIDIKRINNSHHNDKISLDLYHLSSLRKLTIIDCNQINKILFGSQLRYLTIKNSPIESLEAYDRIDPRENENNPSNSIDKRYKTNKLTLSKLTLSGTNALPLFSLFKTYLNKNNSDHIILRNFPLYFDDINNDIFQPNTFTLKKILINPNILNLFSFTSIDFSKCSATLSGSELTKIINHCKNISSLNLSYTQITDYVLKLIKNIQIINLSSCNKITKKGLENLLLYDKNESSQFYLHDLNLSDNNHLLLSHNNNNNDDVFNIFNNSNCIFIKKLNLSKSYFLSDDCLFNLIKNNCFFTFLESLDFSYCKNISDKGLQYLGNQENHLKEINLSHCINITDKGLKSLTFRCNKLTKINITNLLKITTDGLQILFKNCKFLEDLNISYLSINDNDFSDLLHQFFENNTNNNNNNIPLTHLNISHCLHLSNKSLQAIGKYFNSSLKYLNISYNNNYTNSGIQYLSNCNQLEEIDFSLIEHFNDSCLIEFISNKSSIKDFKIKKIILDSCKNISDFGLQKFFDIFITNNCISPIEFISLKNCNKITDDSIQILAQFTMDKLSYLNLHHCNQISNISIESLSNCCSCNLSEIICYDTQISNDCFTFFSCFKNLKSLNLCFCPISDDGFNNFDCSLITNLNIQSCDISDLALENISKSCPEISIINLSSCKKITDEGIYFLSQYCYKISEIYLSNCKISDISLRLLSQNCFQISVLDLKSCDLITSDGLISISNHCSQIKKIILSKCSNINDLGIISISQNCPLIHTILLANCNLTDDSIVTLAENCSRISNINISKINQLTDLSIIALSKNCIGISKINLSNLDNITDNGIIQLAKGCNLITSINISDCTKISDRGVEEISLNCSLLYKIDMRGCSIVSETGVKYFTDNRPLQYQSILELDCAKCDVSNPDIFKRPKII